MIALFSYTLVLAFPVIYLLYSIIGIVRSPRSWRKYLPGYIYALFIGAYCYVPLQNSGVDLIGYLKQVEYCGNLSFFQTINWFGDGLFTENFLFWICGRVNSPHLLPAITCSVVYGIASYISCDVAEKYGRFDLVKYLLFVQFLIIPYIHIINNIRNICAFSIIILAVYLEFGKGKRSVWILLLYVLGTFLHLSAVVLVLCRIILPLIKKHIEIFCVIPFIVSSTMMFIYNNRNKISIRGNIGNGIQLAIQKMYIYLNSGDSIYGVRAMTSKILLTDRYVTYIGVFIELIVLYYFIIVKKEMCQDNKMLKYACMVGIMTLACFVFPIPNYWRFAAAFNIMLGIILLPILTNYKKINIMIKIIFVLYIFLIPLKFIANFLWLYKSVDYEIWGSTCLLTNIFTIIGKAIGILV